MTEKHEKRMLNDADLKSVNGGLSVNTITKIVQGEVFTDGYYILIARKTVDIIDEFTEDDYDSYVATTEFSSTSYDVLDYMRFTGIAYNIPWYYIKSRGFEYYVSRFGYTNQ
ncbi:MAG: hypothetical protein Q4E33_04360 [Erysipelotrichaceae bacterium]|nr:hypothetical protein [Erysipelotrichaceae bacterium]